MHLHYRNINDGFVTTIKELSNESLRWETSRAGRVRRLPEPVTLTFSAPTERLLFNQVRDINPYSILYESLWALCGRDDVEPISYYTPRMREFSDDGKTWHGAYGRRWRYHFGKDQLDQAVWTLSTSPESRRVVLGMWDPRVDGAGNGKDYPCNTHIYLTLRDGRLNLTVCNRSNDAIWGLFGTNYPVFTILQEYLAARIGIPVGVYHHVSNDLHAYRPHLEEMPKWLEEYRPRDYCPTCHPAYSNRAYVKRGTCEACGKESGWLTPYRYQEPYADVPMKTVPLVRDPAAFDREVKDFVDQAWGGRDISPNWSEPFLDTVALPMALAFHHHKIKRPDEALGFANLIAADDWRIAAVNWLERRRKR